MGLTVVKLKFSQPWGSRIQLLGSVSILFDMIYLPFSNMLIEAGLGYQHVPLLQNFIDPGGTKLDTVVRRRNIILTVYRDRDPA